MHAGDSASADSEVEGMKISGVLREDQAAWQKLNVAAFTTSSVPSQTGTVRELNVGFAGNTYLPMIRVLAFATTGENVQRTIERARPGSFPFPTVTEELFRTFEDVTNRAVAIAVPADALLYNKTADMILNGLRVHV